MGIRRYNPTTPGRRGASVSDFAELTDRRSAREIASGPQEEEGRPQQSGRDHGAPSRRRPQAVLPRDRLPPQQGRRPGQGAFDSVRSQPQRPHRSVALRRRREALHPRPRGLEGGRRDHERSRCAADRRQLLAAAEHSAGHGDSQHRDAARPRRATVPLGRHAAPRWSPAKPTGRRSRCPAAKSAASRRPAARRSARSATPTT